jgi:hypothetical protein
MVFAYLAVVAFVEVAYLADMHCDVKCGDEFV